MRQRFEAQQEVRMAQMAQRTQIAKVDKEKKLAGISIGQAKSTIET